MDNIKEKQLQLVYEASWHTYEEWGGIEIFEDASGHLFARDGGYSVYGDPRDPEWSELYDVTLQETIDLIDEWTAIEKEYEDYCS